MSPRLLLFLFLFAFVFNLSAQTGPTPADSGVKVLSAPTLNLPDAAVAAGVEGKLSIALTVDKTGEAKNLVPMSGPMWPCGADPIKALDELWAAVKENVKASKFSPAIKNGELVSNDIMLTIELNKTPQLRGSASPNPSDNSDPKPKIIKGGVINGRALSLAKPPYPPEARANRASGAVSVQVLIDEQGKVIKAGAFSGHPALQASARTAACLSKFSTTTLAGEPVKVSGIITYNFVP